MTYIRNLYIKMYIKIKIYTYHTHSTNYSPPLNKYLWKHIAVHTNSSYMHTHKHTHTHTDNLDLKTKGKRIGPINYQITPKNDIYGNS